MKTIIKTKFEAHKQSKPSAELSRTTGRQGHSQVPTVVRCAALMIFLMTLSCKSQPILTNNTLGWDQSDTNGVTGYVLYMQQPGSTNWLVYATASGPLSTTTPLQTSTPFGAQIIVAATNAFAGVQSVASAPWTNNVPASPNSLGRK
jgi:hypothetical protein